MPRIFDNIEFNLLPALRETLAVSEHADFSVGYFNLRGWGQLDDLIDKWVGGEGACCRVLVGMQRLPDDLMREFFSLTSEKQQIEAKDIKPLVKRAVEDFRNQLTIGAPTNKDEASLRHLAAQISQNKVVVKLFLRHPLHAKLYLIYRQDFNNPMSGYLGSSNLTLAGLAHQGELNLDVLDHDACKKLEKWFNDRWNDKWAIDISAELASLIDKDSWARKDLLPPFYVYLKMAYHLAQEARAGLAEFKLPTDLQGTLLDFQVAAVKIAAHHVNKRGGVLIGDVVGLGKTLMATAVARILEDDFGLETLIICPKNLVNMWQDYVHKYHLRGKVMSIGLALNDLSKERRYRVVIIDESQNLRNREGKRYRAIQEYIKTNESKCILLSATPYNKTYLDLSSQLRLFVPEDTDLGIRPERLLSEMGELEFIRQHQAMIRSLAAFEYSEYTDDWRELMRLYLIRRTRSFIKANYAFTDQTDGRKYLLFEDGRRHYFPDRVPKRVPFELDENDSKDQYARLYSDAVVDVINHLSLPRYGLGNYISTKANQSVSAEEKRQLDNLSRAGKRLMGFCRTNLFKRLESSGQAFLLSVDRHALRNYVYIHALENDLPLPIGIQSAELLDVSTNDEDTETAEAVQAGMDYGEDNQDQGDETSNELGHPFTPAWYAAQGKRIYEMYSGPLKKRFKWISSGLFESFLKDALLNDANALRKIMNSLGNWQASNDTKLSALYDIIAKKHPDEKVLVFTQFADTVRYLTKELKDRGVKKFAGVTGHSDDPTAMAWRFSPVSNEKPRPENELRVLIATDVLSEGQNLQDGAIVVNYDLPWALVRLIQRVGRVDRIGQNASKILCYSFLPAAGLERIIRLRARVKQRLQENGEVVGSDELFFEDDLSGQMLKDLYTEKSGILEGETDAEVDLASYAYQIWHNATRDNPQLAKIISELPDVVYSTRELHKEKEQEGVLVYMKTADGNDSLAWINKKGESVTQSQLAVLKAAECTPDTPALPRHSKHHELVRAGIQQIVQEEKRTGGQLGRPSGARYRVYERLKRYYDEAKKHQPLFASDELEKAIDDVYRFPLRSAATDILNRQMKVGVSDEDLANLVIELRNDNRLSLREDEIEHQEPHIICSLGLFKKEGE